MHATRRRRIIKARLVVWSLLLIAPLAIALAQRATVQLSADDGGQYLVDNYGRSLYLNLADEQGASTCLDDCVAKWPPLLVRSQPTAGEGLDPSLLGTIERENGTTQLTYAGWPLYYYSGDATAGTYNGQAAGERWYLVSATGEALTDIAPPQAEQPEAPEEESAGDEAAEPPEQQEQPPEEAEEGEEAQGEEAQGEAAAGEEAGGAAEIDQELYALGQQTFASICAACHGSNGQGGEGVRLVGNNRLADGQHVANVIVHGFGYMPAIGAGFSDEQVAAVATYVRNSWGNEFGPVSVEEVAEIR